MYVSTYPRRALGDVGTPFPAAVEQWRSLVSDNAGDIPVDFLLAWIQRESGGNPCSYTTMRESGIFQLMPPDNTNQGGTTEAALRAACSGSSQSAARQLTSDELDEQVKSGIRYVNYVRGVAHKKLDAAGVTWDEANPDFWRIVKLQHAYPGPTAGWLATATAQLGRPPASWAEMRAANPGARADVLNNAEWVGGFGAGGGNSSPLKLMILLGGLGVLAALVYRQSRH
jgi:hypothetical protein